MVAPRRRRRRKPMADINVVPYIDVMLVLLVIFMVTAPMLKEGIDVNLPQAASKPLDVTEEEERLVVAVNANGQFFLDEQGKDAHPLSSEQLTSLVGERLENREDKRVYVRGDQAVAYRSVVQAMVALQLAGASNVGLITEPPPQ